MVNLLISLAAGMVGAGWAAIGLLLALNLDPDAPADKIPKWAVFWPLCLAEMSCGIVLRLLRVKGPRREPRLR